MRSVEDLLVAAPPDAAQAQPGSDADVGADPGPVGVPAASSRPPIASEIPGLSAPGAWGRPCGDRRVGPTSLMRRQLSVLFAASPAQRRHFTSNVGHFGPAISASAITLLPPSVVVT